jgi:hypothetical protein
MEKRKALDLPAASELRKTRRSNIPRFEVGAVHVILFMGRQEEIHGRPREYDGGQFPVRHEADLGRDENMDISMFKT